MLEHDGVLEVGFVGFHSVYRMVNQTRQRTGWSELFVLLLILRSRSSALRVPLTISPRCDSIESKLADAIRKAVPVGSLALALADANRRPKQRRHFIQHH